MYMLIDLSISLQLGRVYNDSEEQRPGKINIISQKVLADTRTSDGQLHPWTSGQEQIKS